jgi:hypothetical protein
VAALYRRAPGLSIAGWDLVGTTAASRDSV